MEKKLCGLKEAMREDAATHGEKVADLEEELQVQTQIRLFIDNEGGGKEISVHV